MIVRRVALKGSVLVVERALRFALSLAAARRLGGAAFGRFQYALTVTALLALAADLGLSLWTARACARSADPAPWATSARLRALTAVPFALSVALAAVVGDPAVRAPLAWLAVWSFANAAVDHASALLRARERFALDALASLARSLLLALAMALALAPSPSLDGLCASLALAGLGSVVVAAVCAARVVPLRALCSPWDVPALRRCLSEAWPLGLAGLLSTLYFKGDTVLLKRFAGDAELGQYSAAYKLFEGSMLAPSAVLAVVFPRLALCRDDRPSQRLLERQTALGLLAVGALVAAAFVFAAAPLLRAVYGPLYLRAVLPLRALGLSVPLLFVNYGLTHFLLARDHGHRLPQLALAMLVLNTAANLCLLPRYGALGAALATGLTELALTLGCLLSLRASEAPR